MIGYDKSLRCFTWNGKQIPFTSDDEERMRSLHWWQRIPFTVDLESPGYFRCKDLIEKYFLDKLQLAGKSVLGIGCYEGFQLYLAEALGAERVVGVRDDFGKTPSIIEAQKFAREKLHSSVEFIDVPFEQLSADMVGTFDVVFFFDALPHVVDPYQAIEELSKLANTALFLSTPTVLSTDDCSAAYRIKTFSAVNRSRNKHGVTKRWLIDELSDNGFTCGPIKIWEHDYITLCAVKDPAKITNPQKKAIEELPTDEGREDETAILVMSCKLYEQCWMPFFTLFKKYWPDCPYKVYFGTDQGSYPGVETIEVGRDLQWASNVLHIMSKISAKRVLLFQEDFLLCDYVNTQLIRRLVRHSLDHHIGSLRMYWYPEPTGDWVHTDYLGTIGPFDDFRFTFQLTLWDKAFYLSLMEEGQNPWTTEYVAARRSVLENRSFLGIWPWSKKPVPYLEYAVDKGEWSDAALDLLKREGISLDKITKKIRTNLHNQV